MSGSFVDANAAAKANDVAEAAAQIAGVIADIQQRQAQSAVFVAEYGAAVLDGHTTVGSMVPPILATADAPTNESASSVAPPYTPA
jgi:hypothetical protein